MKAPFNIAWGLLILAVLHSVKGEYRYKIRGPPSPPPKPLPPRIPMSHFNNKPFPQSNYFTNKGKYPLSLPTTLNGHRVIPPMRGTPSFQFHQHSPQFHQNYLFKTPHLNSHSHVMPLNLHNSRPQYQFKGHNLLLGGVTLPPNKLIGHGFRAPALKEPFLPSPPSEFSYQTPKITLSLPQPPVVSHIGNAIDDDKGPIHTIPAPNLSPNGGNHNYHVGLQHLEKPFSSPISASFPHTQVTIQQSHGYEVREPSNDQASQSPDGSSTYFAPDPDPSLPAHKIPATSDPYSVPSNGKSPADILQQQPQAPALQILDNSNSLSSQELFELLHSPQQQPQPQQPLVDSYGVPLVQQPQLQQHFQQQAALYPPSNYLKHNNQAQDTDVLKTIREDFSPDFQTFNYEEQYQGSRQPESYQEQDGSENIPSIVRNTAESSLSSYQDQYENDKDYEQKANAVAEEDAYYDNSPANAENENNAEDYEEPNNEVKQNEARPPTSYFQQIDGSDGSLSSSYYTTLPNREAAETLATLAAAGNINSNLANLKKQESDNKSPTRGDTQPEEEEEYEDEDEESEETQTSPPPQTYTQTYKPTTPLYRGNTRYPNTNIRHHFQRRPNNSPKEESNDTKQDADSEEDQDPQGTKNTESTQEDKREETKQKAGNAQFGARIRPKRNK